MNWIKKMAKRLNNIFDRITNVRHDNSRQKEYESYVNDNLPADATNAATAPNVDAGSPGTPTQSSNNVNVLHNDNVVVRNVKRINFVDNDDITFTVEKAGSQANIQAHVDIEVGSEYASLHGLRDDETVEFDTSAYNKFIRNGLEWTVLPMQKDLLVPNGPEILTSLQPLPEDQTNYIKINTAGVYRVSSQFNVTGSHGSYTRVTSRNGRLVYISFHELYFGLGVLFNKTVDLDADGNWVDSPNVDVLAGLAHTKGTENVDTESGILYQPNVSIGGSQIVYIPANTALVSALAITYLVNKNPYIPSDILIETNTNDFGAKFGDLNINLLKAVDLGEEPITKQATYFL